MFRFWRARDPPARAGEGGDSSACPARLSLSKEAASGGDGNGCELTTSRCLATKPTFRGLQVKTMPHVRRPDSAGRTGCTCRGRLSLLCGSLRHAWRILLPGLDAGAGRGAGAGAREATLDITPKSRAGEDPSRGPLPALVGIWSAAATNIARPQSVRLAESTSGSGNVWGAPPVPAETQ